MESIARALIHICKYVDGRENANNDDDIKALEEIAFLLGEASEPEKECLIETAKELGCSEWPEEMGIS
jgi:hypothetical protein